MAGAERPLVRTEECVTVAAQRAPVTIGGKRRAAHHPAPMPVDIDVAIGWSAAAQTRAGGEAGIRKFAQDAIDHTNAALRATGVYSVTVRLVWNGPMSYVDAPNNTPMKAFEWLRGDAGVAQIRETANADQVWLVTFWTEPSAAPVPITVDDYHPGNGISVVNIIGGVHSAAHEFGHTLGLFHDFAPVEQPPAVDPFPYRYAHYSVAGKFKDIMTPRYKCPECEVWNAFSNASPAMTVRGFPAGGVKSDAARLIPFAAERVAGYSSQ